MKKIILFIFIKLSLINIYGQLPVNWEGDSDIEIFQEADNVYGGEYSAGVIVNSGTQANCDFLNEVVISVAAGASYKISFWGYISAAVRARAVFLWEGASTSYSNEYLGPDTNEWMEFVTEGVVPDGATGVRLGIRFYDVSGFEPGEMQYIDDVTFESPAGTALTVSNGDFETWPGLNPEPADYPEDFTGTAAGLNAILSWSDPSNGQLPENYLIKASTQDNITNPEDGIYVSDDLNLTDGTGAANVGYGVETFTFSNLNPQTVYYFKIFSYTNASTNIDYKNDGTPPAAVVEISSVVVIESGNFDASWGNWTPLSVLGYEVWDRENSVGVNGTPCALITGYNGGTIFANEDWLISPSMDLTQYDNELLSFYSAVGYITEDVQFVVRISQDYDGSGNPNDFTWISLDPVLPDGSSNWVWTASGVLDISGFNGDNVHIAFVYFCGTDDAATWEVDEIMITGELQPPYFTPIWATPYNPMTFYILEANLDDLPMQPGDEVGLFDIDPITGQEICVGAGMLVEELNGTIYLEIIASMDDGSNPDEANGFSPGNNIIYKLWKEVEGEIENVSSNYPYPGYDEVYTSQGSAFVELNGFTTIEHCIGLTEGWNIISSRAMPENPDMLAVVQPLIDAELLFKVLDEAGGSVFHLPFPPPNGQWSNTIGDIEATEGYYMKVVGDGQLCMEGFATETPLDIPLTAGWNIISYPCESPQNALDAVQPLIDQEVLFKVISEDGGSIFHLPFPPPNGQWSNTIGNFESGEGYYVKVNENTSLTITCPADGGESTVIMPEISPTSYFQPVYENNPYMPMHVVLQTNEMLDPGDEIAVFDGEICVGASIYPDEEHDYSIIPCAMDDPSTNHIDGFISGNNLNIKIWSKSNDEVLIPSISIMEGDTMFDELGTMVAGIDMLTSNHETGPMPGISIHVMPNPFKESTKVGYSIPDPVELTLRVLDVHGNVVFGNPPFHAEQNQGVITLDFTNYEPGVYLIWISLRNSDMNRLITKRIIHF